MSVRTDSRFLIGQRRRLVALLVVLAVSALGLGTLGSLSASAAGDPCVSGNAVACENSKPGNPESEWDLGDGEGDATIQGFATQMSVTPGSTVQFKVKSNAAYTIKVYRLGYYNGMGARLQSGTISVPNPATQPTCISEASTQNYDCGNWSVSASWAVPGASVSGVYVAHLVQANGDESHITFVVRDDSSHSAVLFKTSDATWQAYNLYGGADFYTAPQSITGTQPRAFKISYNRPFATRGLVQGRDFLFSNEYPTLRFMERNGIDVSYTTDVDVSVGTSTLTNHQAFMSVGHDEYWTAPERTRVEAARDAGVNLMFLSGNEVYWHTRLEPSIDGTSTANRTLVCYKDTWEPAPIDPNPEGTGTWRDPRFKAAPNASNPENGLTGTLFMSNNTDMAITVSAAEGRSRFWRNTSVATLATGASATLAPHTVGYESDEDLDNGFRPAGLMRLSTTTGPTEQYVGDPGGYLPVPGTTTHSLTLYRAASGALVFGAGTIQWGWGLDQNHDGDNSNPVDPRMQQATLNMLADMGAVPTTLMAGMVQPTASTDTTAPVVTVAAPAANASVGNGSLVTVSGTATDAGGVVTTVEVSLDGGTTYHRATGTSSWTYTAVQSGVGAQSIKVRASDDSANLSTPVSRAVTVNCPCSLFGAQVPATPTTSDSSAVELGVQVRARDRRVRLRHPLLEGRGQHRHPHGHPVELDRCPARRRHVQQRDGQRLADPRPADRRRRHRGERPTSRPTSPPAATTPPTATSSRRRTSSPPRSAPPGARRVSPTGCSPTATPSRRRPSVTRTTGSTSSSPATTARRPPWRRAVRCPARRASRPSSSRPRPSRARWHRRASR